MEFFKTAPMGAILTLVVAIVIGSQGSRGGHLAIFRAEIYQYDVWWQLYLAATALVRGFMFIQR